MKNTRENYSTPIARANDDVSIVLLEPRSQALRASLYTTRLIRPALPALRRATIFVFSFRALSDNDLLDLEPGTVVDLNRSLRCNRLNDSPRANKNISQVDIRHHGYCQAGLLRAIPIECLSNPTSPRDSLSNSSKDLSLTNVTSMMEHSLGVDPKTDLIP